MEKERGLSLLEAAKALLALTESYEVQIEGEWGRGRTLLEMEEAGDLPAEIINARQAIRELLHSGVRARRKA